MSAVWFQSAKAHAVWNQLKSRRMVISAWNIKTNMGRSTSLRQTPALSTGAPENCGNFLLGAAHHMKACNRNDFGENAERELSLVLRTRNLFSSGNFS